LGSRLRILKKEGGPKGFQLGYWDFPKRLNRMEFFGKEVGIKVFLIITNKLLGIW